MSVRGKLAKQEGQLPLQARELSKIPATFHAMKLVVELDTDSLAWEAK